MSNQQTCPVCGCPMSQKRPETCQNCDYQVGWTEEQIAQYNTRMNRKSTSMTYGTMPTRTEWNKAFDEECPDGWYHIQCGRSDSDALEEFILGDGEWNAEGLYKACLEVITASQSHEDTRDAERALNFVAGIMETLGFEWV